MKVGSSFIDDDLIECAKLWINGKITFEEFASKFTMEDLKFAMKQLMAELEDRRK
jgi:hypothetical protein